MGCHTWGYKKYDSLSEKEKNRFIARVDTECKSSVFAISVINLFTAQIIVCRNIKNVC